jgi:CRISPR/Cas system CMR-associated protein Cmr3 (group 5 of RAMP superfamily)
MPFADLFISPGHGIQVNNKIVRARDLINGKTITQSKKTEEVTYYHIELATHAMIDANGVAAESYLELTKNKPTPTSVTSA